MKEYISKEYLYSILNPRLNDSRGAEHYAYDCIKQEIDYAPDSDIVHFQQGHWIPYQTYDAFHCSECGRTEFNIEPYCHCGAIMTKGDSNGRN